MAPTKKLDKRSKVEIRREFRNKRFTSLRAEGRALSAHVNRTVTKRAAAYMQAFMTATLRMALEEEKALSDSKRITSAVANEALSGLGISVPSTSVVTSYLISGKPKLVHPLSYLLHKSNSDGAQDD